MIISTALLSTCGGIPFLPTSISGCQLWLNADSLGLSDGTAVSSWTDLSGTSNTATQATGALQPIYKIGVFNGHAALLFTNSKMSYPNDVINVTGCNMFFAMRLNVAASSLPANALLGIGNAGTDYRIVLNETSNSNQWGTYNGSYISTGNVLANGTPYILEQDQGGGGATNIQLWQNGVSVLSNTGNADGTNGGGNFIGAGGGTDYFSGYMAEVIGYNVVLSSANRTLVNNYLRTKYGTS